MSLDPTIESFYLGILNYSGLEYDKENNFVVNANKKFGDFTVNGKKVTLPYHANLKHPNGKSIFHPLNESFLSPESPLFLLYKKRLVCELNLKLACLIISLINVANSIDLQNKLTDSKVINMISAIKNSDMTLIENFMSAVSKSKIKNDEAFLFDIFLKKNGEIGKVPFSATGKIVFNMPKEIEKSLEAETKDNHVYGAKLRISDLNALNCIFKTLFGEEKDRNEFVEGTDNKVFRYLNILLTTSYLVSNIINEVALSLKDIDDGTLGISEAISDLSWIEILPNVYKKTDEIRRIPNQDEFIMEEKTIKRAGVNESQVMNAEVYQQPPQPVSQSAPQMHPVYPSSPPQMPVYQQPPPPVQTGYQREMDASEFMAAKRSMQMQPPMQMQQPQYYQNPQMYQHPAYPQPPQQQAYQQPMPMQQQMPGWMAREQAAQMYPQQQQQQYRQQMPAYVDPQQMYSTPGYGGYYPR